MKSARQDTGRSAGREALLLAALPHVAFDGWTAAALQTGAADAGIPPEDIKRLFPGGAGEALRLFSTRADQIMTDQMNEVDLDGLGVSARVTLAIRTRIEALGPNRVPHGRRHMARGGRPVDRFQLLHQTGDADRNIRRDSALLAGR
jgi:rpsU-divergently transcribed protein